MDANLKREKPADMLRVEAAYCGDEIVGLRITADDPARQLLVWADNSVMNGFRIGNEFIAGWDKKIEYRDVVIGEPEPAAPAAAITPKPDEWDVRGHLAASLTFWHRLKGDEADELVAALQSWATRMRTAGAWIERWYGSGGKDGYEGWSIVSKEGRGLVAYLGRNAESGAVTEIVMAHNATLAAPTAQAAPDQDLSPWPDFAGNPIRHGARMWHPISGQTFTAVRLSGYSDPGDAWRAIYDDEPQSVSRLVLQIGDKGQAVIVTP